VNQDESKNNEVRAQDREKETGHNGYGVDQRVVFRKAIGKEKPEKQENLHCEESEEKDKERGRGSLFRMAQQWGNRAERILI